MISIKLIKSANYVKIRNFTVRNQFTYTKFEAICKLFKGDNALNFSVMAKFQKL